MGGMVRRSARLGPWRAHGPYRVISSRAGKGGRGGEYGFSRRKLLLAGLWLTAAAAEWAALRPVIFQEHVRPEVVLYHVVGGSFAACGLLAWHRRPESRAGPLMVVTGLLFFVHGTLGRLHSSFAETIGIAVSNCWIITFAALLRLVPGRSAPVGRERETRDRRLRRRRGRARARVDAVRRGSPQPRAGLAEPAGRERIDKAASLLGFAAAIFLAILLVARWLKATRPSAVPALRPWSERSPCFSWVG